MGLYVSDYKARQARCAAKVFGAQTTYYPRTREGWKLYWQHARIAKAASVGRSFQSSRAIISGCSFADVHAPWPMWGWGETKAQVDWRAGEFHYRLMLAAAAKIKGGYAAADSLVRKADAFFNLGYFR